MRRWVKRNLFLIVLFFLSFFVSLAIFFHTFRVDKEGNLLIAAKLWSDFGSTIPLIRSFSLGENFPPEYPIFPGRPIRYHFGFYAIVGLLERSGIRIDIALNTLSALSFSLLVILIYLLAQTLFQKRAISILSITMFLFPGSLGFINYFKKNPIFPGNILQIFTNREFASFGPYDRGIISAFWNLNIYTNQRHLAMAYSFFIVVLILLYRYKDNPKGINYYLAMMLGLVIGMFPFFHMAVFGMIIVSLGIAFLLFPRLRLALLLIGIISAVIAFPQVVYMGKAELEVEYFRPGYLIEGLTPRNFVSYWFMNLGLNLILPFIGFLMATKDQRKMFIFFFVLFVIGNTFVFTTDIATNHKFFNIYLIGASVFSAYALYTIWRANWVGKITTILASFILTFSGLIDFFPILNDGYMKMIDIKNNPAASYILTTPKKSVFLNSKFLYDNASIAGRRIFMGWPYFSWGAGYDTIKREKIMKAILNPSSKSEACHLLEGEGIDYVEMEIPPDLLDYPINHDFYNSEFVKTYSNPESTYSIYSVSQSCKTL